MRSIENWADLVTARAVCRNRKSEDRNNTTRKPLKTRINYRIL